MGPIKCEMCGGTDLIKQDGVFVCQNCGMKYSIEEARKMFIEGTVDVSGSTVKVDNSAFVKKYLANARRAKEKEDWEETEKYYNMVEQNDPDNIEAIFFSTYAKAKTSLIGDDIYKRQAAFKVLANSISIIDDHYNPVNKEENQKVIDEIATSIMSMLSSSFVYHNNGKDMGMTYDMFRNLLIAYKDTMDNIEKVDDQAYLHLSAFGVYYYAVKTKYWGNGILGFSATLMEWCKEEDKRLNKINSQERKKYLLDNPDEISKLKNKQRDLMGKIDECKAAIEKQLNNTMISEIENQVEQLDKELRNLGFFKDKERMQLYARIDPLKAQLKDLKDEQTAKLSKLEEKIKKMEEELATVNEDLALVASKRANN